MRITQQPSNNGVVRVVPLHACNWRLLASSCGQGQPWRRAWSPRWRGHGRPCQHHGRSRPGARLVQVAAYGSAWHLRLARRAWLPPRERSSPGRNGLAPHRPPQRLRLVAPLCREPHGQGRPPNLGQAATQPQLLGPTPLPKRRSTAHTVRAPTYRRSTLTRTRPVFAAALPFTDKTLPLRRTRRIFSRGLFPAGTEKRIGPAAFVGSRLPAASSSHSRASHFPLASERPRDPVSPRPLAKLARRLPVLHLLVFPRRHTDQCAAPIGAIWPGGFVHRSCGDVERPPG